jgi:hypothetical protein
MIDRELATEYIAKYQGRNSWRRIARESQVLGCTPVWQLLLGAGVWPAVMRLPVRGLRF